jgi:two-component sensor histidine kinase
MLFVDNLISGRCVSDESLHLLLPFCEHAAIAIESTRLRQSERAQTMWLKEAVRITNHRVKNNLQVALAIIDTELLDDGPIDRATLQRIRRQIHIVASVNGFLGDTSPEVDTSLAEILPTAVGMFQSGKSATFRLDVDDVVVNTKQAIAVALILDQLLDQATIRKASEIEVTLRSRNDRIIVQTMDDGAALPQGFRPDPNETHGLGLVERLARWDLLGRVTYANQPLGGVSVAVEFPLTLPFK